MSANSHPSARELHAAHADERLRVRQLERLQEHEAEVRRLDDERWRRCALSLLANPAPEETDFHGCTT